MTRYCLQCDDGTTLVHKRHDLVAQVRQRPVTVKGVMGWHCPTCGEVEFDAGEGQRYSAEVTASVQSAEAARRVR